MGSGEWGDEGEGDEGDEGDGENKGTRRITPNLTVNRSHCGLGETPSRASGVHQSPLTTHHSQLPTPFTKPDIGYTSQKTLGCGKKF
ncbi:hypothetical protein H1Q63_35920 [Desmonostoc muscorum CCALA 125]|nr:hypothetical protein [Desmonostoc muscorum CCALA 125]